MRQYITMQDSKQRALALDCHHSFIMQAPAGSGKTEILIQRILALLAVVQRPEEILALTFTKKAAAEMRHRVIQALAMHKDEVHSSHQQTTYELAQKALQQNKKMNWHLQDNPARLQISTIDSFATTIAKQLPILSKTGGHYDITENANELYKEAFCRTIEMLEQNNKWSEPIQKLSIYFDNQFIVMQELFVKMLQKREQWLMHVIPNHDSEELLSVFNKCLRIIKIQHIENVYKAINDNEKQDLLTLIKFAFTNISINDTLAKYIDNLEKLPLPNIQDQFFWELVANLLLTKNGSLRKTVTKSQGFPAKNSTKNPDAQILFMDMKQKMQTFLENVSNNEPLLTATKNLQLSVPISYTNTQWEIVSSIFAVLPALTANLMLLFKEKNILDFCEVNLRAMHALGKSEDITDLSLSLDYKINHLLIDEFQDTSVHHFNFIQKITSEWDIQNKTIFIVGDPMQSIYKFREADVSIFLKVKDIGINNIQLQPLVLTSNFRSVDNIVNWSNKVFANGFPKSNDITTGAIAFSQSFATQASNNNAVYMHTSSSQEQEAEAIVKTIKEKIAKQPKASIAILGRARKHLRVLIKHLQEHHINFIANEIDNMYEKSTTQDLLAITRAITNPEDKLAWLAVLRAPWLGIQISDLLVLSKHPNNIYEGICEQPTTLSAHGQSAINNSKHIFQYMLNNHGRMPLHTLVKDCWEMLNGPQVLNTAVELSLVKRYLMMLSNYEEKALKFSLEDFTEILINTHTTPEVSQHPSVELMTIHKSKGLEFDYVFILGSDSRSPAPSRSALSWSEITAAQNENLLLMAPAKGVGLEQDSVYDYLQHLDKVRESHERKRLMYVAATRAKKELHLFVQVDNPDNIDEYTPNASSLIAPFWDTAIKNSTLLPYTHTSKKEDSYSTRYYRLKDLQFIDKTSENPFEHENKNLQAYELSKTITNKNIGIVTHMLLRTLAESASDMSHLINQDIISKKLRELGTPSRHITLATSLVKQAIHNAMHDITGKWIISSEHSNSTCELQKTAVINGKLTNIIIDRTFVSENTRWIIDYKISPLDLEHNYSAAEIKNRYGEQLDLYANILSLSEKLPIMLGIYLPLSKGWYKFPFNG